MDPGREHAILHQFSGLKTRRGHDRHSLSKKPVTQEPVEPCLEAHAPEARPVHAERFDDERDAPPRGFQGLGTGVPWNRVNTGRLPSPQPRTSTSWPSASRPSWRAAATTGGPPNAGLSEGTVSRTRTIPPFGARPGWEWGAVSPPDHRPAAPLGPGSARR